MITKQHISKNITAKNNNLNILKQHFSHCFDKNGNFDLQKFAQEIVQEVASEENNSIDFSKESYGMDWLGKSYARILATDSAKTFLKENTEWNNKKENQNSENILIKGDNLEVLKHLSNAYYQKVKMIYIDPPYNTGNDGFIYEDDRKFSPYRFKELAGISLEQAKKVLSFVNSKSNSHSAWLTFMYPRLYIAKQLLKDDGVIFVSIDDNEVAQLKILMDEIFGEENFQYQLTVINNLNGNDNSSGMMETHEYCLIYSKANFEIGVLNVENDKEFEKWEIDEKGYWKEGGSLKATGINAPKEKRPNLFFPIFINEETLDFSLEKSNNCNYELLPQTDGEEMSWYWCKDKFIQDKNEVIVRKTINGYSLYKKQRPSLGDLPSKRGKTSFYSPTYSSSHGNIRLLKLFDKKVFDYSKSPRLIKDLLLLANIKPNDIILDFFAGSGTTGDAVMQLNAEDIANGKEGNRKYILVQIPEKIDPKKNKIAYDFVKNELNVDEPTIFEITKERLVRAGKKIHNEQQSNLFTAEVKLDFGFKIFETLPIWENFNFEATEFDSQLKIFDESTLSPEDLQTILLTWKTYDNIPLSQNLESIDFNGYTGYYGKGKLYLVNTDFQTKHLKAILEKIDEDKIFNPTSIIVFGYNFANNSKNLREIAENVASYANKKNLSIDFIIRY